MSRRAVRVGNEARVERFGYTEADHEQPVVTSPVRPRPVQLVPSAPGAPTSRTGLSLAFQAGPTPTMSGATPTTSAGGDSGDVQDAFAQGYAQGERAGIELAARQLQAVHGRLGQTIDQLLSLREELTYRTERQVVDLAMAIAARILHREVSLDRELLLVMARLALDRMGDGTTATIRLHPDDEAAARGSRDSWPGGSVSIVADAAVKPGGCLVQTEHGQIEVGVDAQLKELASAILGDMPLAAPEATTVKGR